MLYKRCNYGIMWVAKKAPPVLRPPSGARRRSAVDTCPRTQDTTPAPAITLAQLQAILAKGRAAQPDLADRMDKATVDSL
jgi:hypothetical protein